MPPLPLRPLLLATTLLATLPALASPAEEAGEEHVEEHAKEHTEEHFEPPALAFGLRGAALGTLAGERLGAYLGGAAFVEVDVEEIFEVELSVSYLGGEDGYQVPLEVLFKRPIHLTPSLHPFIGGGLLAAFVVEGEEMRPAAGITTAAGATWWLLPWAGVTGQLNYNLLVENLEVVHEAEAQAGLIVGF